MTNSNNADVLAEKGIDRVRRILRPAIADNARTRRFQAKSDEHAATIMASMKESGDADGAMNPGLAFCYFSPISRYHNDEELGGYACRAFEKWAKETLEEDGVLGVEALGKGWHINTVTVAYIWYEDAFDEELKTKLFESFKWDANRFRHRGGSGQVGNQEMARYAADLLYAYILSDPEYITEAIEGGDLALERALAEDGQVLEQYGPCPHYSYLTYAFAFKYAYLKGTGEYDDRLRESVDWFRKYHTESFYLIAGPSTRKFHSREMPVPGGIYRAFEHFGETQPMYKKELDRMSAVFPNHDYSWTIMLDKTGDAEPTEADIAEWNKPFARFYERIYYGRGPIKYGLVSRKYQTGITFTGWLPLMGLQTWAWGQEPPIVHPAHDVPSGTEAWGVDTARFPCSHLYYKSGPGCMAAEVAWRGDGSSRENLPDEPAFVVWRNSTLRSVAIFTDVSTVLILTGPTGRRVTRWALNTVEPAEPVFEEGGVVRFEGRVGCLHAMQQERPELLEQKAMINIGVMYPTDEVVAKTLAYETDGETATAFALSNDSFCLLKNDLDTCGVLEFKDDAGTYRADISTIVDERGDLTYGLDTAKVRMVSG